MQAGRQAGRQAGVHTHDRFAQPSKMRLSFVGNISVEALKPLLAKFIANIPTAETHPSVSPLEYRFPDGVTKVAIRQGTNAKAVNRVIFPVAVPASQSLSRRSAMETLNTRLTKAIREDRAGTYSVSADLNFDERTRKGELTVAFTCQPDRAEELCAAVLQVVEALLVEGPTEKEVDEQREKALVDRRKASTSNDFWLTIISMGLTAELHGIDMPPSHLQQSTFEEAVRALTVESVHDAFQTMLQPSGTPTPSHAHCILLPE